MQKSTTYPSLYIRLLTRETNWLAHIHVPIFISKESSFSEAPNFSYFQPEFHWITCIDQQFGKAEKTTMINPRMVPMLQKLSKIKGDIFGCHGDWGPLLAFSGWEMEMPNVLKSMWLFHIKKCCLKCQQRENRWTKLIKIKQGEWPTDRQTSVSATEIHSSEKHYLHL